MEVQNKREKATEEAWPPLFMLWKSRLPAIVVPVLAGLRQLSVSRSPDRRGGVLGESVPQGAEVLIVLGITLSTGYLRLPFTVTWWLIMLAAFALETQLLLGVAVTLSLSVILGWYGVRLCHPHAVSALWGGARGGGAHLTGARVVVWKAWDLFVHLLPALMVLYAHGPSLRGGQLLPGTPTAFAVGLALPLNVFWLWGLGLGMPSNPRLKLWPRGMLLTETNVVYRVEPKLPQHAWNWIYGSHWCVCASWLACLVLPGEVLFVYGVFLFVGLVQHPFTEAWWTLFLAALYGGGAWPLLESITWCCAVTTSTGFYGTQVLVPGAFRGLMQTWLVNPVCRRAPARHAPTLRALTETSAFFVAARIGDLFLHALPTSVAIYLFRGSITSFAALAALPTNLLWLVGSGQTTLAGTNKVYGIAPDLPGYVWNFIYMSHWVFCAAAWCFCARREAFQGQVE